MAFPSNDLILEILSFTKAKVIDSLQSVNRTFRNLIRKNFHSKPIQYYPDFFIIVNEDTCDYRIEYHYIEIYCSVKDISRDACEKLLQTRRFRFKNVKLKLNFVSTSKEANEKFNLLQNIQHLWENSSVIVYSKISGIFVYTPEAFNFIFKICLNSRELELKNLTNNDSENLKKIDKDLMMRYLMMKPFKYEYFVKTEIGYSYGRYKESRVDKQIVVHFPKNIYLPDNSSEISNHIFTKDNCYKMFSKLKKIDFNRKAPIYDCIVSGWMYIYDFFIDLYFDIDLYLHNLTTANRSNKNSDDVDCGFQLHIYPSEDPGWEADTIDAI